MKQHTDDISTQLVAALRAGIEEIKRSNEIARKRVAANLPHNKTYSEHSGTSS